MSESKAKIKSIQLPKEMCDRAKKEFRRIKRELIKMGVMEIDRPALMAYLQHYALWEEARDRIRHEGSVIETPKGQMQINPWHSILKQNSELLKKWVNELGFSPASRKRLGLEVKAERSDKELFE